MLTAPTRIPGRYNTWIDPEGNCWILNSSPLFPYRTFSNNDYTQSNTKYIRLMDVIKQHLNGSPLSHIRAIKNHILCTEFCFGCICSGMCSLRRAGKIILKNCEKSNVFVFFYRLHNGFSHFHHANSMQKTPHMHSNTSPNCFEGPRAGK